jgi:hypothetical protein
MSNKETLARIQRRVGRPGKRSQAGIELPFSVHFLGLRGMKRNSGFTVMIGIEGTGPLGRTKMPSSTWRRGTMTMQVYGAVS